MKTKPTVERFDGQILITGAGVTGATAELLLTDLHAAGLAFALLEAAEDHAVLDHMQAIIEEKFPHAGTTRRLGEKNAND